MTRWIWAFCTGQNSVGGWKGTVISNKYIPWWAEFMNPSTLTLVFCFLLSLSLPNQGSHSRSVSKRYLNWAADSTVVLCAELWICKFASQLLPKGILKAWFLPEPRSVERRADEWLIYTFLISDAYVHEIWKWLFLSFLTSVEYILNWLLDSEVTGEGRSRITYSILG